MNHILSFFLLKPTFSEKELKQAFENGHSAGYEQGVIDGMAKNFERSAGLNAQEYEDLIKYLVDRNLELCCYDVRRGGFAVRRRIYYPSNPSHPSPSNQS